MSDLLIGGNTYLGVDYIRIPKTNGKYETFILAKRVNEMYFNASLSGRKGGTSLYIAKVKLPQIAASLTKEKT